MASYAQSIIGQLLFVDQQGVNLAHLVHETRNLLETMVDTPWLITWDHDDIVTFDMPNMRVLLAWTDRAAPGLSGVLTFSVGPSPVLGRPCDRPEYSDASALLYAEIQRLLSPFDTIWHEMSCTMSAEWIDLLIDALPDMAEDTTPPDVNRRISKDPQHDFVPDNGATQIALQVS